MITIHRHRPVVIVDGRRIVLTEAEHRLLTTFGQMDNRVIPIDLLMDIVIDHPVRLPRDREVIWLQISRLRKKIGCNWIRHRRNLGYQLTGDVSFR